MGNLKKRDLEKVRNFMKREFRNWNSWEVAHTKVNEFVANELGGPPDHYSLASIKAYGLKWLNISKAFAPSEAVPKRKRRGRSVPAPRHQPVRRFAAVTNTISGDDELAETMISVLASNLPNQIKVRTIRSMLRGE